jgi:hypothetical protein
LAEALYMNSIIELLFRSIKENVAFRLAFSLALISSSIILAYESVNDKANFDEALNRIAPLFFGVLSIFAGLSVAIFGGRLNTKNIDRNEKVEDIILNKFSIVLSKSDTVHEIFYAFRIRMIIDSERLKQNSFKNLSIGIIFSFSALALLGFFIFAGDERAADGDYIRYVIQWFIPRITIVLLLQFVGFFFLRLYVSSEFDLKHNKNEITNIEAKIMAYEIAKETGEKLQEIVVRKLAETERNFMIKRNERTISMENESTHNDVKFLFEKILDKLPSAGAAKNK